jgi:hypothetical protein
MVRGHPGAGRVVAILAEAGGGRPTDPEARSAAGDASIRA